MQTIRFSCAAATTALLAATLFCAAHGSQAAKPAAKTATAAAGSASQGKSLVKQPYGCTNCHGANLAGRQGFSPSIQRTGAMHDYTQAQFVTLMHTGIQNDGSHVKRPMPVYAQMPTPQAKSIYAYLMTLK